MGVVIYHWFRKPAANVSVSTNSWTHKSLFEFAAAILFTGLALLLRWLIDPWVGDYLPLATLYGSVAATVWLGGYRPAIVAVVLGYLGADWFFIRPRYAIGLANVRDTFGLLAYVFSCGLIIAFGEALRAARRQAMESQYVAQTRQAELEKEAAARQQSDQRLQMALAAATMGIWEWEIPTDRMIWSAEVSSIYGLAPGESVRTIEDFLKRVYPNDRAEVHQRVVEMIERPRKGNSYEEEYRILWPNGEIRWVASKGSVIIDDDGKPLRLIGTVMDATERKRAEEQAQRYASDLWRMGRIRTADQTALSLAHELNQPLTAIALQAGIVSSLAQSSGVPLSPDLASALREISEQAQRGGGIIRALRDLVKRGTTRREPVQLNDVVREVVRLVEALVRQHKAVVVQVLDDLPLVNADRIQIAQVLMNLLQNALDALRESEPEHRSIEISTRVNAAANTVEAAVRDFGPGVPPEIAERVFERFYTTKTDGIGLGLAIAHSIVEAHQGKLWLETTGTHGTTFRFCLPIPVPAAAAESPS